MIDDDPARKTRAKFDWRNRDHTRGSLAISLLVLALPSLATSLSGVAFQITELTFISRLGEAPMASVVIVNQTLRQIIAQHAESQDYLDALDQHGAST